MFSRWNRCKNYEETDRREKEIHNQIWIWTSKTNKCSSYDSYADVRWVYLVELRNCWNLPIKRKLAYSKIIVTGIIPIGK